MSQLRQGIRQNGRHDSAYVIFCSAIPFDLLDDFLIGVGGTLGVQVMCIIAKEDGLGLACIANKEMLPLYSNFHLCQICHAISLDSL